MKKLIALFFAISVSLMASNIEIKDAYARATPPVLPNSAAFLSVTNNTNSDIALVEAQSSAASVVELHTHDMKDGVMKMYKVPEVPVKANSTTTLKPGGYHVMLIGLKEKPLKVGQTIDLTLVFSNGEKISLKAPIKTVMGGMMKKGMSCGQGKCGSGMKKEMKKGMSCGQGKCGSSMKKEMKKGMSCGQGKCGSSMKN